MLTLSKINSVLRREKIPLELVRGDGYHYFEFDDGVWFDTVSVDVCYTSHLRMEQWIVRANSAMEKIRKDMPDAV